MKEISVVCIFFDPSIGGDRRIIAGSFAVALCGCSLSGGKGVRVVSALEEADIAFYPKEGDASRLVVCRGDGEKTEIFSPVSPSVIGPGRQDGFWDSLLVPA